MPFPVLDRVDFTPTAIRYPLADYFNPTINPNFVRGDSYSMPAMGRVTVADLVRMAKSLVDDDSINDIIPMLAEHNNISNPYTRKMYRYVYDILPADRKYLIFWTSFGSVRGREPNLHDFTVNLQKLRSIDYYESYRDTIKSTFTITKVEPSNYDTFMCTEEQLAELAANLASTGLFNMAHEALLNNEDNVLSIWDYFCPFLIRSIILYQNDLPVFTPTGNTEEYGDDYQDLCRPSQLLLVAQEGTQVNYSVSRQRVNFSMILPPGDRRRLERVLNYSANVISYLPYTIKGQKEQKAPLYGVELEANGAYTAKELITAQKDLFFICKSDSTIYGTFQNCYELVTVPATLRAHKRLWAEFFEKIDYSKFDTSKNTGNGMHVHIGRDSFTMPHLNRFTWFITNPANFDFILAVSERPNAKNLAEWAKMPNHYAARTKTTASRQAVRTNGSLRGAVHYKGNKTVEVRLFKGIVSYATVVKNIEFVDSVFHYTQAASLIKTELSDYLAWLATTPKNKYQMLKAFLSELKVDSFTVAAQLNSYLWSEANDSTIGDKLNKAPFKVTPAHIVYLNKKRRKRTFILKDGKIECLFKTGGLLAKLDKSIQQKQTRGAATFVTTEFAA